MSERRDHPTQNNTRTQNEKEIRKGLNENLDFSRENLRPAGRGSTSYLGPSPFADNEMKKGNNEGD